MKKLLSLVLCLVLSLSFISCAMSLNVSAASYDQISENQTWQKSWDGSKKYVYLTVSQTGYYNLNITDFAAEAGVLFYITDMEFDSEDYSWYNTRYSFGEYIETYERENLYLIEDHLYQIEVSYGEYDDESDEFVNFCANLSITFTKTDYAPIKLTLNSNKNLSIGCTTYDWLEFKTTVAGDYLFTLNDYADFNLYIYEKNSGKNVEFTYFDFYKITRLNLKANTEYIIATSSGEQSDKLVRLNISKATSDITNIDLIQSDKIWADDIDSYNQKLYLSYNIYSEFQYKVTYSDNSNRIFYYEDLRPNGISIDDVIYIGGFDECYTGEIFMHSGNQPVQIVYMGDKTSESSINVTSYVDWLISIEANTITDFDDMRKSYEEGYNVEGYWLIKPDETNNYEFYSSEWYKLDIDFFIFDQNNTLIPYREGYNLKEGNLYSLRAVCTFEDYYSDGFVFHFEPTRDHVHSYSNACDADCNVCGNIRVASHVYKTTTTKATTSKNGSIVKKCSVCRKVASNTAIYYPKTFKLSTTSYTYNGKEKKPSVKVYDAAGKLISSSNYTIKYKDNKKVGKATVTVTFKGNYSGTKTLSFTINPKATTVSKLTAAKKSLKVSIKKQSSQTTGYEIQYSTSKKFSSKYTKTKKVTSYKTTSVTLKSLKAKKTYYVRVRTYKTVNGKKYYSGWSTAVKKKTK